MICTLHFAIACGGQRFLGPRTNNSGLWRPAGGRSQHPACIGEVVRVRKRRIRAQRPGPGHPRPEIGRFLTKSRRLRGVARTPQGGVSLQPLLVQLPKPARPDVNRPVLGHQIRVSRYERRDRTSSGSELSYGFQHEHHQPICTAVQTSSHSVDGRRSAILERRDGGHRPDRRRALLPADESRAGVSCVVGQSSALSCET